MTFSANIIAIILYFILFSSYYHATVYVVFHCHRPITYYVCFNTLYALVLLYFGLVLHLFHSHEQSILFLFYIFQNSRKYVELWRNLMERKNFKWINGSGKKYVV